MKITNISVQAKNPDRVNVSVDGVYRFSLDVFQVGELGLKVGKEYSDEELTAFEQESQFGKLYMRALEYTMLRPHSEKEVRDYLWRKTRTTMNRRRSTGEVIKRPGVSQEIVDKVFVRLQEKGYVDDEKFARYWVENRNLIKGTSQRKLIAELRAKGIEQRIITIALEGSSRDEVEELRRIVAKKRARYDDKQKFLAYLMRQGFSYDTIQEVLSQED